MQIKLGNILAALLLLCSCCSELLQAAPYPSDAPENPVQYRRFTRRRPVKGHPELEEYEVRHVYIVRRPTPKPKKIQRLTDFEMDLRIKCDFEPTLPNCAQLATKPISSSSSSTTSTSSSTTTTTTTTTTEETPTTSTTTTTTTDLPLLPELPELPEQSEIPLETTTQPTEDEDDNEDFDGDDVEDNEDVNYDDSNNNDDDEKDPDAADYINSGGSIGGNDPTK